MGKTIEQHVDDTRIIETALRIMSNRFDEFIGECIDENGKPKQPDRKAIMRARSYLPKYCKLTLIK